jgi:lipoprotein-releasing system permease protein
VYKLFVGLRYLRSKKISFFSISGIAVGVMVLVVVLSVMGGFIREMRGRIKGILSDIIVERGDIFGFTDYGEVMSAVSKIPHVTVCSPHLEGLALVRLRNYRKWAYFKGVDPDLEIKVGKLGQYLVGGCPPDFKMGHDIKKPWPVVVGRELVEVGRDEAGGSEYMAPGEEIGMVTLRGMDQPQSKAFTIAGIFKSGMFEFDSTIVYLPLDLAQRWRGVTNPPTITSLSVALDDYRCVAEVKRSIQKALGPSYMVKTWEEERAGFLRAIALERSVMGVILFFIIIVAGFMILALLTTVVGEKTKDIGILKAIGGTTGGILQIFLLNGLLMGLIGAAIGVVLGLSLSFKLNWIADRIYDYTGFPEGHLLPGQDTHGDQSGHHRHHLCGGGPGELCGESLSRPSGGAVGSRRGVEIRMRERRFAVFNLRLGQQAGMSFQSQIANSAV